MQSLIPKPLTAPALNASHIQKFSKSKGRKWNIACVVFTVVLAVNLILTGVAMVRWSERHYGIMASGSEAAAQVVLLDSDFAHMPDVVYEVSLFTIGIPGFMLALEPNKITKKSQEYTKFKALYRKAFPRAERVPVIFLMNEDVDGTLNACYVESGIKNEY